MRLYDNITQSDLNNTIDLLLNNYHRELSLNIDDSSNPYCNLTFDLSDGVDAGSEIIFNNGDELMVTINDKRLALMGYTLHLKYYQLDKGDYSQSKQYGELQSLEVKLEDNVTIIPFTDNQVYLQKDFELVLIKDIGYRLLLSTPSSIVLSDEDVVLTADYTLGSVPVEDANVSFYDGETLIDTGVTNNNGIATLTLSDLSIGSHNFNAVVDGLYSNNVNVTVISDNDVITLGVTGNSFRSYNTYPFIYTGKILVDWGDDTGLVEYTGGYLSHSFTDGESNHTVKVYGDITSISENCFWGCTGLTSITLPNTISSLRIHCFAECTGLTSITLPNTVSSLGTACFSHCTGLTSIEIPSSVTILEDWCFEKCTGLTSIILNWTSNDIITYKSRWISNTSSNLKFHIPHNTTSLYLEKNYPSDKLVGRSE